MQLLPCNESFETTQAYDNDAVERCIGLAVASAIETMTIGLTRTGGQGADAPERSKRCVAVMLAKQAHFLSYTRGLEAGLHYIRSKDGAEVDFCRAARQKELRGPIAVPPAANDC